MNTSSKFVVATHILTALSAKKEYFCKDTLTKSDLLAESVNTNPVVIRRILGMLNQAGLIISKSGPNGGAILSKNPQDITLDEIYVAVGEEENLFHFHYQPPSSACPVGANIQKVLGEKLNDMKNIVKDYLASITLKEIMDDTLERSGIIKFINEGMTAEQIEEKIYTGEILVDKT